MGIKEKSREVRLGLVMYGGVSLAIYINGIAHELFRAVRGRGTYRLLKALTDSDIVVDVLSGSSAGGINGVLLAYALCNEREFDPAAALWRRRGDIGDLLRGIDEPLESYQSLLDSENKYEPWLREAFEDMERARIEEGILEDPSPMDELDLFVTGTDFYGRKSMIADDRGSPIQVKDHRTVFWLKHRRGRKEPFAVQAGLDDDPNPGSDEPTTHAALARLSRITSCFPGAFAPVTVGTTQDFEKRLRHWGALPETGARVYIDGGVLDNKPFSTTLEAIYSRLSERPVSRWLLYVEPDPERFEADPEHPLSPNVVKTALTSLTALPAYESIADDLRTLRSHNERVLRVSDIRRAIIGLSDDPKTRDAALSLGDPQAAERLADAYDRFRLIGLADHVFQALFTRELEGATLNRADLGADDAEPERVLRVWFETHVVQSATKADASGYLELDIDFRLRRLLHLTYANEGALLALPGLYYAVNRQIQTLETIRGAMEAAVERVARNTFKRVEGARAAELNDAWASKVWGEIWDALTELVYVAGPARYDPKPTIEPPSDADRERDDVDARAFAKRLAKPEHASDKLLFFRTDDYERKLLDEAVSKAPANAEVTALEQTYERFEQIDSRVYPIELASGLRSYDVVEIARVSPLDARLGLADREMNKKVTGLRFSHFAAFFKRSWRSNDILWGRLDGACELVDTLIQTDRIEMLFCPASGTSPHLARVLGHLNETVSSMEGDHTALPLPPLERDALFKWLKQLGAADMKERQAAIARLKQNYTDGKNAPGPLRWLVEGTQLEVLPDGLRNVFFDAASEQLAWNEYPAPDATTPPPVGKSPKPAELDTEKLLWSPTQGPFMPGGSRVDPGVIALAAATIAQRSVDRLTDSPARLQRFFANDYHVGEEDLSSIPPLVLVDRLTRGLLVARNSLLASAGKEAEKIRSHPLYQVFLGYPLRALAAVSGMLRGSPQWLAAFTVSSLVYIVLSLVVAVLYRAQLFAKDASLVSLVLFVGMPLGLGVFLLLIERMRSASDWLSRVVRFVGVMLALALLGGCVPVVVNVMNADPSELCQHLLPPRASALCQGGGAGLVWLGRFIVLVAAAFGLLSLLGVPGSIRAWRASRRSAAAPARGAARRQP